MGALTPALRGVPSTSYMGKHFLYRYKCAESGMTTFRQGLLASSQSSNCSAAGIIIKGNSRQTVVSS